MSEAYKVIGVISGARGESNSAAMVREALKGAEEKGASVKELFLPGYRMNFCQGCLSCMKEGKCYQDDDFNKIREMLYEADAIIWGSPTYAGAPNAMMKNLIDRLGMYEVSTSSLGGKYMAGISAASSAIAAKKVARGLSRIGANGTFMRSYASGYLGMGFSGGRKASDDKKVLEKARRLGNRVYDDLIKGRTYPFQNIFGRIINNLILKPAFTKYIQKNKDGEAKILYTNLRQRELIF